MSIFPTSILIPITTAWRAREVERAIHDCFTALEEFYQNLPRKKIALTVTADHGMTAIDPKTTVYLNQEIPSLASYLKCTKQGEPIVPAGSSRDFFLYVKEESLSEVEALLNRHLKDRAIVVRTQDLISANMFGSQPVSPEFLSRVGNLVILPCQNESVWWYEKGKFEQKFFAMHGGLSRDEMESIFLFLD